MIATELFIAENTVENHLSNIRVKLHLHSRVHSVCWSQRVYQRLLQRGPVLFGDWYRMIPSTLELSSG